MSSKLLKLKAIGIGQIKLWLACILIGSCVFLLLNNSEASAEFFITSPDAQRGFGALIAQLAGTFAAVLLTSVALVFALPDRPLLSEMRHSGHFLDLLATLCSAIAGCFAVMLLAVALASVSATSTWFNIVLSSFLPLGLLLFQAGIRFLLTMIAMVLPT